MWVARRGGDRMDGTERGERLVSSGLPCWGGRDCRLSRVIRLAFLPFTSCIFRCPSACSGASLQALLGAHGSRCTSSPGSRRSDPTGRPRESARRLPSSRADLLSCARRAFLPSTLESPSPLVSSRRLAVPVTSLQSSTLFMPRLRAALVRARTFPLPCQRLYHVRPRARSTIASRRFALSGAAQARSIGLSYCRRDRLWHVQADRASIGPLP